jgi:hypothetical protein
MRTICKILAIVFVTLNGMTVYGAPSEPEDSLQLEVLMGSKMLDDIHLKTSFINSLNVTTQGHILLSSANQFYLLGWGGIMPVGEKISGSISSFAYSPDGYLMIVQNNELCYIDTLDRLARLYELPGNDMGISAGENVMYLYDKNKEKKEHALYILSKGHKYAKLFVIPTPISSVLEIDRLLLFATENKLFSVNLMNNEIKALVALPQKEDNIVSIAADTLTGNIYFSSKDAVYSIKDKSVVCISDKFGGTLQYFNDGLLVFKPERKFLIRLNIERGTASSKIPPKENVPQTNPPQTNPQKTNTQPVNPQQVNPPQVSQPIDVLTNSKIIELVKNKLSDEIIISIINYSSVDFNLSVDSMIDLSNQQVSSKVILAMKQAMKRQILNQN